MILNLDTLKQIGAFTGAPVEREIKWRDNVATVFVRPLSYKSAAAEISAMRGDKDVLASRIASCICGEDGSPVFTPEDITGDADPERGPLDEELAMALLAAIADVSGLGKTKS